MGDSVGANKFHIFSPTVANLLYENAYLEIYRLIHDRDFWSLHKFLCFQMNEWKVYTCCKKLKIFFVQLKRFIL